MKLILAVIQPTKLAAVREALERIEVTRMTVCDGQGFARRQGQIDLFCGGGSTVALLRKIVLEIVVNDDFLDRTVETIAAAARTGHGRPIDDGHIFVLPADQAFQVDDAASGPGAV